MGILGTEGCGMQFGYHMAVAQDHHVVYLTIGQRQQRVHHVDDRLGADAIGSRGSAGQVADLCRQQQRQQGQ